MTATICSAQKPAGEDAPAALAGNRKEPVLEMAPDFKDERAARRLVPVASQHSASARVAQFEPAAFDRPVRKADRDCEPAPRII